MDDLTAFTHDHRSLAFATVAIWLGVSLSMLLSVWTRPSRISPGWKFFWSLVLAVPVLGWIMYLGLFRLTPQDRAGDTAPPRWSY